MYGRPTVTVLGVKFIMKVTSCIKVRHVSAILQNKTKKKTVITPEIKHAPNVRSINKFICSILDKTICEMLLWSSATNY